MNFAWGRGLLAVLTAAGALTLPVAAARASEVAITRVVRIVTGPAPFDVFRRPVAIAVDSVRGVFAIADAGNHRLALFDQDGRARGTVITPRDGRALGEPHAVAIDTRGRLFVVDEITHRIHVLNARGSVLAEIEPELPDGVEPFAHATDIAIGALGGIYVLYGGELPGVMILDERGRTRSTIGFSPESASPFRAPVSLAVNADETLLAVTDPAAQYQVSVIRPNGTVVFTFGEHEEAKGGFSLAVDVIWGPDGTLWVTDTVRHSISVFTGQGSFLGRLGGMGSGPGQFQYPAGCAFLAADRIVVIERAGARFQVLEVALPSSADAGFGSASPSGLMFKEEDQL